MKTKIRFYTLAIIKGLLILGFTIGRAMIAALVTFFILNWMVIPGIPGLLPVTYWAVLGVQLLWAIAIQRVKNPIPTPEEMYEDFRKDWNSFREEFSN